MMNLEPYPAEIRPMLKAQIEHHEGLDFSLKFSERAFLSGPPGTGKSKLGMSYKDGPVFRTTVTQESCAAEKVGHWIIGQNGTEWHDGIFTKWWRTPRARLLIDEVEQISGDLVPALHAFSDDSDVACYTLNNGETIKPAEGITLVTTSNYDATALPEALRDRFVLKCRVDYPNPIILNRFEDKIKPFAAMALYGNTQMPEGLTILKSTRTWVDLDRIMKRYKLGFSDALRALQVPNPVELMKKAFSGQDIS